MALLSDNSGLKPVHLIIGNQANGLHNGIVYPLGHSVGPVNLLDEKFSGV